MLCNYKQVSIVIKLSFINFANDKKIPSYQLVNTAAFYNFTNGKLVFLSIFSIVCILITLTLEADGTAKYFVQMPRNFMISIKYKAF